MSLDAPIALGPFTVDPDGRLCPSTPEQFPSFHVHWREHRVDARLAGDHAGGALELNLVIGRVPSTGRPEQAHSGLRREAFATLDVLPRLLPPGWRVLLTADHRVAIATQVAIELPTPAENLVSDLTMFLLRLDPYLDLLAEGAGVEPLADDAGTANTCPG